MFATVNSGFTTLFGVNGCGENTMQSNEISVEGEPIISALTSVFSSGNRVTPNEYQA